MGVDSQNGNPQTTVLPGDIILGPLIQKEEFLQEAKILVEKIKLRNQVLRKVFGPLKGDSEVNAIFFSDDNTLDLDNRLQTTATALQLLQNSDTMDEPTEAALCGFVMRNPTPLYVQLQNRVSDIQDEDDRAVAELMVKQNISSTQQLQRAINNFIELQQNNSLSQPTKTPSRY